MISISLCMIVRDEEKVIGRCLKSVCGLVDEIIIVDTGSTDKTKEIVSEFTNKIYNFDWIDDFSAARNYAFSLAKSDFCMWLDADDVIKDDQRQKLKELKNRLSNTVDFVMMKYVTAVGNDGKPTFFFFRERLIKNFCGYTWEGEIHEAIAPRGNIVYSDIEILHDKLSVKNPKRNLEIFEKMMKKGKELSPRETFYYARELFYHGFFEKAICRFEEFLEYEDALVQNKKDACRFLFFCFSEQGDEKNALSSLFKSFEFDLPDAAICCEIGGFFLKKKKYKTAEFWYKTALKSKQNEKNGAFVEPDYFGFIPSIQLCLCFFHMGDIKKAVFYNEKAGKYNPTSKEYLNNKLYFEKIKARSV